MNTLHSNVEKDRRLEATQKKRNYFYTNNDDVKNANLVGDDYRVEKNDLCRDV